MRYVLFVVLCLFIVSCKDFGESELPDNVAIFPASYKMSGFKNGRWTPTKNDIVKAEKILNEYISSEYVRNELLKSYASYDTEKKERIKENVAKFIKRFPTDKRQYFGIKKDGKKLLTVNGFCYLTTSFVKTWKEGAIVADDGGDCYYKYKVDLNENKIFDLWFNGSY